MKCMVLLVVVVASVLAQTRVPTAATATSASAFKLGGAEVLVAGIPNWPVALGDEIQAGETPVTLKFQEGHRVTLAKGAKARIEADGKKTRLRLLTGSCSYLLASSLNLGLFVGGKPAVLRGPQGTLTASTAAAAGTDRPIATEARLPPPPGPAPPPPVSSH